MSYFTTATCVDDPEFRKRVTACFSDEGGDVATGVPTALVWSVAGASDVEAAYASALAAGNPHPGSDEAVITDQMILSAVQANMPSP